MISPQCCLLYPALVQGPKNDHIPALLICSFLQFLSLGTWHLLEALFGGSTCLLSSPYMCECTLSRFSHVRVCETPWTVANQVPLSKGFSRQEYWSGLPFPSPGYLPDPGIKLRSLMSPELADGFFTTSTTWEAQAGPKLPAIF